MATVRRRMKSCPKCQSDDIVRVRGDIYGASYGNYICTGFTLLSAAPVTRYVCLDCGFTEEWVESKRDLEKIRKKFKK